MRIENMDIGANIDTLLSELRSDITIEHRNYLVKPPKKSGKYRMVQCPFHKDGQENTPSMGIKEDGSICHCFTCGAVKTIPQLITKCLDKDGATWLREKFDGSNVSTRSWGITLERPSNTTKYVDKETLKYFNVKHPYMYERKLTDDIIEMFDVGYDKYTNCITFPVKDISGNILFFAKRAVDRKYFHYPESVEKPLYGIYELSKTNAKEVYICESILDALFIWTCGKYAIALNGLGSWEQIKEIEQLLQRKIILALDNDERGKNAREKLKQRIKGKSIYEIDYNSFGNCKDVQDMTVEQFVNANIVKCSTLFDREVSR